MGFYAAAPDHKIFYNIDGSAAFTIVSGVLTGLSGANMNTLNSEQSSSNVSACTGSNYAGVVFPCLMDIEGIHILCNGSTDIDTGDIETSSDTTNGQDGTWALVDTSAHFCATDTAAPTSWRTEVYATSQAGINGIRFTNFGTSSSGSIRRLNVYGTPTAGENPNRLRFWHPSNDAEVVGSWFDFEEQSRNEAVTKTFRVKNNSASLQANDIVLSADALTAPSPTLVSQTTFSSDDITYTATLDIGDLAAGAISSIVYVKIDLDAAAQLGPWRERLEAEATSWT